MLLHQEEVQAHIPPTNLQFHVPAIHTTYKQHDQTREITEDLLLIMFQVTIEVRIPRNQRIQQNNIIIPELHEDKVLLATQPMEEPITTELQLLCEQNNLLLLQEEVLKVIHRLRIRNNLLEIATEEIQEEVQVHHTLVAHLIVALQILAHHHLAAAETAVAEAAVAAVAEEDNPKV